MTNMKPPQGGRNTGAPSLCGLEGRSATELNGQAAKGRGVSSVTGGWMPENISGVPAGRSVFHLTSPLIGLSVQGAKRVMVAGFTLIGASATICFYLHRKLLGSGQDTSALFLRIPNTAIWTVPRPSKKWLASMARVCCVAHNGLWPRVACYWPISVGRLITVVSRRCHKLALCSPFLRSKRAIAILRQLALR